MGYSALISLSKYFTGSSKLSTWYALTAEQIGDLPARLAGVGLVCFGVLADLCDTTFTISKHVDGGILFDKTDGDTGELPAETGDRAAAVVCLVVGAWTTCGRDLSDNPKDVAGLANCAVFGEVSTDFDVFVPLSDFAGEETGAANHEKGNRLAYPADAVCFMVRLAATGEVDFI